jgi:hypothetical protein
MKERDLLREIAHHGGLPPGTRGFVFQEGGAWRVKIVAQFEGSGSILAAWRLSRYFRRLFHEIRKDENHSVFVYRPWYEARVVRDNDHGFSCRIREVEFQFETSKPAMVALKKFFLFNESKQFEFLLEVIDWPLMPVLEKTA